MANNEEMTTSILIQGKTDAQQIKGEVDKAAGTAQSEMDKKKLKIKLEADKTSLEQAIQKSKQLLEELRKTGDKAKINLEIRNQNELYSKLAGVNKQLKEFWDNAEEAAGSDTKGFGKLVNGIKNTAVWGAVIGAIKKTVDVLIQLGTNYDKVADQFNRFTGSAEKTKEVLDGLNSFASTNGLDVGKVRDAAAALLQLGINADEVVGYMDTLGNIAQGTGSSIEDLTDILADIKEEGNLTADTFNELVKAGVPIGDQLAKDLGISVDEVKKLATEWKITEEQVNTAFKNMATEGGVFAGAMDEYASTFEGKMNTFKDTLVNLGENIANSVMPAFEWLMGDAQETADALINTGSQGTTGLGMIQKALYAVVTAFRGAIKVISNFGSIMGTVFGSAFNIVNSFISDIGTNFVKLFNADTWTKLGSNMAYGIGQWVNKALGHINKLIDQVNKIPGLNIGKISGVNWGEKSDIGFDFKKSSDAIQGAKMAMEETIKDLAEDWQDFFIDTQKGWENAGKEAVKTQKKTNATLADLIKKTNSKSKGGSSDKKENDLIKQQKEDLVKLRDLKIQEIQDSTASEKQKNEKLLEIYNWYKDELIKIEWKTNDELLKSAEDYINEYYKKMQNASEKEQKLASDSIKNAEKYQKAIEKLGDQWEDYKNKALKNIREVNNSIAELDKEFNNDIAERYNAVNETIKDFENKNGSSEWLKGLSIDDLRNWGSDKISDIPIKDAIEYLQALKEQKYLTEQITDDQKELAKTLDNQSESERLILDYQQKRAALEEEKALYNAVANQGNLADANKELIKIEDDLVSYYDAAKGEYVKINDFKNQELARDLQNQQLKLTTEYEQQQTALNNELDLVKKHSQKVLDQWQSDTKAYKKELDNRVDAVRQYVSEVQSLLASVPDSYRAYGGELNKGVTMVGENWPEAIVRRQASYVQPRNAVQSYSTVNNNQSSFSINGLNVNVSDIDEFLGELKNRLTYRK